MIYFIRPFFCAFFAALFFIIFLSFVPIFILRFIISKSVKYLRKDFGRILGTRSVMYGVEDIYRKPKSTIVAVGFMNGKVDIPHMRKMMNELLFKNENLIELTEYIEHWLGFCFWRKDLQFDVSNHIREHQADGAFGDLEVQNLRSQLLSMPFAKKRSPWEFVIGRDYRKSDGESSGDLIFIRFHHSLGDGQSLTNFCFTTSHSIDMVKPSYSYKGHGKFAKILMGFKSLFLSPMDIFMTHVYGPSDKNELHLEEKCLSKEYFNAAKCGDQVIITVNDVKRTKTHFGVSFQSIVYSSIAGSIRRTMRQANMYAPSQMKIVTQVPIAGYSGKLENRFGVAILNLPIGEKDAVKRLKLVHQLLSEASQSTLPYAFFQVIGLIGGLFSWMTGQLAKIRHPTVAVTSFPGPLQTMSIFNVTASDCQIAVGLLTGSMGIGFQIFTYKGRFSVTATVDKSLCADDSMATNLVDNFLDELNVWQKKS